MRVSSSAAVRSKAGYERRSVEPSSDGSAMLQWTSSGRDANSGHTSRNAVAQRDHGVEPVGTELVDVLDAIGADVDPPSAEHANRVGMQRLGMAAGTERMHFPRRHLSQQGLGDLRACAVARAQEQHPSHPTPASDSSTLRREQARAATRGATHHRSSAARFGRQRGRSRSSTSRPSAELRLAVISPPSRSRRRWYETRLCGSPTSAVSSRTTRSLSTSSRNNRQRNGFAARRTNGGGPPGSEPIDEAGCTRATVVAFRESINPS